LMSMQRKLKCMLNHAPKANMTFCRTASLDTKRAAVKQANISSDYQHCNPL